jgi:hypothetical protein
VKFLGDVLPWLIIVVFEYFRSKRLTKEKWHIHDYQELVKALESRVLKYMSSVFEQ